MEYDAYQNAIRDINQSCNTVPDDEYDRLAAQDEVDRLLKETAYTPPKNGRHGLREPGRPFSFA